MTEQVNLFDFLTSIFKALYSLGISLYNFIVNPLNITLLNNSFVEVINNCHFSLFGFDVYPFSWLISLLSNILNFSILDALPTFIICGLLFIIIKHFLP